MLIETSSVVISNIVFICSFHSEEIEYIMMCVDANQDGKVDFHEFTDRFHNPAKDIGFTTALLLTNLSEHMPNDPRYVWHFNPFSAISNPPFIKLFI